MHKNFYSKYGKHIQEFIIFKRNLGFKYENNIIRLKQIDDFAIETNQTSEGITKSFADLFIQRKANESKTNQYNITIALATSPSYLNSLRINPYTPTPLFQKATLLHIFFLKNK